MREPEQGTLNRGTARGGFLTIEAALGATLLLFVFIGILSVYAVLWQQLQAAQQATLLARRASVISEPPGTTRALPADGASPGAEVAWDDAVVRVRVESARGLIAVERVLPREVP